MTGRVLSPWAQPERGCGIKTVRRHGGCRMRKGLYIVAGLIVGYTLGSMLGAFAGGWINIFPPDRVAGGPEAGFGTVIAFSLAGSLIGIPAGIWIAVREANAHRTRQTL